MINKKNIFIFTSTRADYGLQHWIIKEMQKANKVNTYVIVGELPHQKSTPNSIDASYKKVLQIVLIIT